MNVFDDYPDSRPAEEILADLRTAQPSRVVSEEEQVIRDWLDGQLRASGSPLPPSLRTSQPLPRRQVTAVVATLIELLDEARDAGALRKAAIETVKVLDVMLERQTLTGAATARDWLRAAVSTCPHKGEDACLDECLCECHAVPER